MAQVGAAANLIGSCDLERLRNELFRSPVIERTGLIPPRPLVEPFRVDNLEVLVYRDVPEAGRAARIDDIAYISALMQAGVASPSVLVARARSQLTRWAVEAGGLADPNGSGKHFPVEKMRFGFMDEFWAQSIEHAGSLSSEFRNQVTPDFLRRMPHQEINPLAKTIEAEIARYAEYLRTLLPFDLAMTGIGTGRADGTGAHKAFMDAPWANGDLNDPNVMISVRLPEWCRRQQMNDFGPSVYPTIDDVPAYALSVTMATILTAKRISSLVVGEHKAQAVKVTLTCNPDADNPASLMRAHPFSTLYLDRAAAAPALAALGKSL